MFIYVLVDKIFKAMSKYSISILSFIYTFTVLIVIVFGIEIEQKITKRGKYGIFGYSGRTMGVYSIFCYLYFNM